MHLRYEDDDIDNDSVDDRSSRQLALHFEILRRNTEYAYAYIWYKSVSPVGILSKALYTESYHSSNSFAGCRATDMS